MEDGFGFDYSKFLTDSHLVPKAVLEISETISNTENVDELYSRVHQVISKNIPAQNFYIALYDKENNTVSYPYFVDQFESKVETPEIFESLESVTSYALSKDNPLLITSKMLKELIESGEISNPSKSFNQWLGVPLKTYDKKTIGLIAVQSRDKETTFTDEHKNFLSFVSVQIAHAIQYKNSVDLIKRSEEKFRTFYEKNPLMLFIIDEEGKIIEANEQVELDLGYSSDELIGENVVNIFHPDDRETVQKNFKECFAERENTYKWELRKITKSGKTLWVRESANTLHLPGERVKVLITCENITDYKNAAWKVKEKEESYRLLTENIDEMILLHDSEGNIHFVNEAGLTLTNYSREILLQTNVYSLFSGEYSEKIVEYISDTSKQNSLYFFEMEIEDYRKNLIPLEISVTKLNRAQDNDRILLVARDITERRVREDSIKKYNEELKSANYAKDKFFSIIAHDLRSPFNALLSYADFLIDDFEEMERSEIKEYVTHIGSVSKNIYDLLNNLLDWSRLQTDRYSINKSVFNLEDKILEVSQVFKGIMNEKNMNLEIDCEDKCFAEADENMISTVLRNLLSNAIKFSEPETEIKISAVKKNNFIEVSVEDQGMGMLSEDIAKIFRIDINHTTLGTNKEKGTGLGLVLSKEMVEKNGGQISVVSQIGKGSKFTFTIPVS